MARRHAPSHLTVGGWDTTLTDIKAQAGKEVGRDIRTAGSRCGREGKRQGGRDMHSSEHPGWGTPRHTQLKPEMHLVVESSAFKAVPHVPRAFANLM
eukprot:350659-Chlamydomonas_euryale.AAC.4